MRAQSEEGYFGVEGLKCEISVLMKNGDSDVCNKNARFKRASSPPFRSDLWVHITTYMLSTLLPRDSKEILASYDKGYPLLLSVVTPPTWNRVYPQNFARIPGPLSVISPRSSWLISEGFQVSASTCTVSYAGSLHGLYPQPFIWRKAPESETDILPLKLQSRAVAGLGRVEFGFVDRSSSDWLIEIFSVYDNMDYLTVPVS